MIYFYLTKEVMSVKSLEDSLTSQSREQISLVTKREPPRYPVVLVRSPLAFSLNRVRKAFTESLQEDTSLGAQVRRTIGSFIPGFLFNWVGTLLGGLVTTSQVQSFSSFWQHFLQGSVAGWAASEAYVFHYGSLKICIQQKLILLAVFL